MSRHEIPHANPCYEITVGWDNPLQTYFVIIKDNWIDEEDDCIILWEGCRPHQLYEIDDLQKAMREYALLDSNLKQKLYADKDEGR